ncbi:MAG: Na+/H+ antiporter subunit E [bacterium]|nr:Na+/H+ antiporter subunit E [bacterium]
MAKKLREADVLLRSALFFFTFWTTLTFPSYLYLEHFLINLAQYFIAGAVLSVFVAWVTRGMFLVIEELSFFYLKYMFRIFLYWMNLFLNIILAGIDVARRVMRKDLLISPGIIEFYTPLKDDWLIAFNSNSITLTPGTITVDVKKTKDGTRFLIHCICREAVQDIQASMGFVKEIERIYRDRSQDD